MTHINQRRDTSTNWTAGNPVLQLGEVGWETDNLGVSPLKAKLGDGTTAWNDLTYAIDPDDSVTSVAGKTGAVTLDKSDVGLENVNNTADSTKPISVAQQAALDLKAPLASPAFTGNPTVPTPAPGDNDTSIANTEFIKLALDALGDEANETFTLGDVKVQWGSENVAMGGAASVAQTVTFPTPFSGAAVFIFTSVQTGAVNKLISSLNSAVGFTPTATNFSLVTKTGDGTTSTATPTVYWVAIGPA